MHIVGDPNAYKPGRLRMAFGSCSAKGNSSTSPLIQNMCQTVLETVDTLKALSVSQLRALPPLEHKNISHRGYNYLLTVFRDDHEGGNATLVVRSYYPTLWLPNIISNYEIGKIYVEGILITKDDTIVEPSDEDLWRYR